MSRNEITPRRLAAGLLIGAGVAALLLSGFVANAFHRGEAERFERRSLVPLRALAEVVDRVPSPAEARAALGRWSEGEREYANLRWVSLGDRSLEFSRVAADRSAGETPRRLVRDEKPLFDLAQRLRTAVETNREEGSAREEEVDVVVLDDGRLRIAVPVELDGTVDGLLEAETVRGPERVERPALRLLGVAALPAAPLLLLLFALGGTARPAPLRIALALAAAAALVGGLLLAARRADLDLRAEARAGEQRVADTARSAAARAAELLGGTPSDFAPGRWDGDRMRRPFGHLADDSSLVDDAIRRDTDRQSERNRRGLAGAALVGLGGLAIFGLGWAAAFWRTAVRYRVAYAYAVPALLGMLVLVFFPFFYGIALSFTNANIYNTDKSISEIWVGPDNYKEILGDVSISEHGAEGRVYNYRNFYWTLGFTIVWTVSNVTIGVTLGLALALALNTAGLAGKPIYRVLLILPWAMPNYITALIWKGMFHQQFGVINQVVQIFGGAPVSWFEKPLTSFATVLTTNGWLSFPFMMVISLGALQSIPGDLYEAARVDGASRWQQFRSITLPLLKPALIPAIIISVIWTFNMFNIIYLVSQGEPGGATEILITEAYKIAFEQYRYGYAAAYSTVIFLILLAYGTWQNRFTKATEGI
jgi:arabinogalactan oligomer/maltooligosaccharide transport system permease protein